MHECSSLVPILPANRRRRVRNAKKCVNVKKSSVVGRDNYSFYRTLFRVDNSSPRWRRGSSRTETKRQRQYEQMKEEEEKAQTNGIKI
jgi:hypothetical protein